MSFEGVAISLQSFENDLHASLLERGFDYYENDQILEVIGVGKGQFVGTIAGSIVYDMFIELEGEKVKAWDCSCPYDAGPVCKHLVAFFYFLKGNKLYLPKNQQTKLRLDELVDSMPAQKLRSFVLAYAKYNRSFRNALMDYET